MRTQPVNRVIPLTFTFDPNLYSVVSSNDV